MTSNAMNIDLTMIDYILETTRSVRKRLDFTRSVEPDVIERCIEIASQAPTGGNRQGWHFVIVTDPSLRFDVAEWYRRSYAIYREEMDRRPTSATGDATHLAQLRRVRDSSIYLAEHMHEAPVLLIPCIEGRVENAGPMAQAGLYGSIIPAAWSIMLALRARGLGSAWTTLHLRYEREVAAVLGIPDNMTQAALLPVAYTIGTDFKPAARIPMAEITSWNGWGKRRENVTTEAQRHGERNED